MSEYQSFNRSALGYSHIKKGTVCQDFSGSWDEGDVHIAVVSDGHGQSTSFRSDTGSRMAVETAMEVLKSFAEFLRNQEELLFQPEEQNSLLRKMADKVVRRWQSSVWQHWQENPFAEEEYALAGEMADVFRAGKNILHVYGATLIAALVTPKYLLVMHQGDGRCVVIQENGRTDQPVPWDSRCVGNVCTSLCHSDAAESCRFYVQDLRENKIAACYVTTDGVEDCFLDATGLNAFFCDLTSRFARDGDSVQHVLADLLPVMSKTGSADDASVAAVVNRQAAVVIADRLRLVGQFHRCRTELHNARNKLDSMERKLEYLKKKYQDTVKGYGTVLPGAWQNPSDPERMVQDAGREYDLYVERYDRFRNQAKTARAEALRILHVMQLLECSALLEVDAAELSFIQQKLRKKTGKHLQFPVNSAQGEN